MPSAPALGRSLNCLEGLPIPHASTSGIFALKMLCMRSTSWVND
ncbi:MAG: hypothetical protein AB1589_06715 [Cyanobacteriota bacterium]